MRVHAGAALAAGRATVIVVMPWIIAIEIQRVMTIVAQAGIDDISFSALNKE